MAMAVAAATATATAARLRRVPRLGKLRPGPVGLALTLFDVWRRLPPKQRKQALALARKHGPKAASKLLQLQRARRGKKL
jgi:hypothetical protein